MTPSDEKVVLAHIGEFEVYVYPYKYPDTVFLGAYPTSTSVTSACVGEFMAAYNKSTWFLNGEWQNKSRCRIGTNARRRACEKSYNAGLKKLIEAKK